MAKRGPSSITVSHPSNSPQSIISQVKSKYAKRPVGLPNQGWTCYFNVSLQCLCATSELWSVLTPAVTSQCHLLKNLVLLLKLMRNGQAGLDASIVLGRLGALISRKSGKKFITNTPQDAPEVIAYILDEILICPTISSQLFQIRNRTTSTCDVCHTSSASEDLCSILTVPVSNSVSSSLSNFFSERALDGENQWFCPLCNSPQDATYSTKNHGAPQVIIVQLARFTRIGIDQVIKLSTPVRPDTSVSITETVSDTETIIHIYNLVGVICHSGNYVGGHYTATVLDRVSNKWFLCNDRTISETTINICEDGYTFFYVRERLAIS